MKKLIALVLTLAMVLTVCLAFAEEPITLKIAHIGPTTGAAALYGLATQHGAEIAVEEINAAGGKYQIELITEDDEHNVEKVPRPPSPVKPRAPRAMWTVCSS